ASNSRSFLSQVPKMYKIISINVDGVNEENTRFLVIRQSGLEVGQEVLIPHDEAFGKAIKQLYRFGLFSDVKIVVERFVDDEVYLLIKVKEEPRLREYTFSGSKGSHKDDLTRAVPLLRGQAVRSGDVERSERAIIDFYTEKGHPLTTVETIRTVTEDNRLDLTFLIERGEKVEVQKIVLSGNEVFSDGELKSKLKNTKEDRWWRIWKGEKFDRDKFEEDKQNLLAFYNEKGYYDARIIRDTSYVFFTEFGSPGIQVEIDVHEGPMYRIRNITWEGNTAWTDEQLSRGLGLQSGDPFNVKRFESNLYANSQSTDVASLYYNRGYVRFNVVPSITEVSGDSLDLAFEVFEGDIFNFGSISIEGNTKTRDHVILRQLRTVPGNTFSRDAIQRSLRELAQLGYFNPETMIPETRIDPEKKVVDVTYKLEETGGDQLEFSGGWGGFGGILLQAGVTFNNFSMRNVFNGAAWKPLPSGDGQKLSLSVQVQGSRYQSYSISFQEPWFKGKPRPVGVSVSHTRYKLSTRAIGTIISGANDNLSITSLSTSYGRALRWPDDYFSTSSSVGYRLYQGGSVARTFGLPPGSNQALTFTQRLSRNSLDDPMFPAAGSSILVSLEVAPPLPSFIQYHKWTFDTSWNLPLSGKLSVGVGARFGFLGSLNNEPVQFERYLVGGTPFDANFGRVGFGKDIIYTRGYPAGSVGLRDSDDVLNGGTVLNKYTSEARFVALRNPQLALQLYGFLDAVNTWDGWNNYNPSSLFRSGGFGLRIFLPILGMLSMNYGYNFDRFLAIPGRDNGDTRWRFQFSLGQAF
ncbi:MAG: outer membrane protein assembly factor BamA, partial [Rhodothermia bacterium]